VTIIIEEAIIHLTDPSELISNLCYPILEAVLEAEGSWKIHERHVGSFVFLCYFYCRSFLNVNIKNGSFFLYKISPLF
jgi:hypothetical protein